MWIAIQAKEMPCGRISTMRAARTDTNQKAIVFALRRLGCSVKPTHMVGDGFPDIVVGFRNSNYLFEIKDPDKPPSARKLTPMENKFHIKWQRTSGCNRELPGCYEYYEFKIKNRE